MKQFLKTWMLPISMLGGVFFHSWIGYIKFLTPYLIFIMLTVTYTRISPKEFSIKRFHWILLLVQMIGGWSIYFLLYNFSPIIAQGGFLCFFICTATSAPVITGMLGGSIAKIAVYSFLTNFTLAVCAPLFLSYISGDASSMSFYDSFMKIGAEVVPLLTFPIIVALVLRYSFQSLNRKIATHQSISFYLWSVALFIVVGNSVSFIIKQPVKEVWEMIGLAIVSLFACCIQFYLGRIIGKHYGDPIAGAQGLGQKNTILAIWLALSYLNPIISVAPATYVGWQNIINSTQLYRKAKKAKI